MEIYYEKNLSNEFMNEHPTRFNFFNLLKKISLTLLILATIFVLLFHDIPLKINLISVLTTLLSAIGFLSPFIITHLIATIYLNKKAVEYDYHILGSTFRIIKVLNRKKRKLLIEIPISSISSIGAVNSPSYERYLSDKTVKKVNAYCNGNNELIYAFLPHDGERKLVIMESDAEYLSNLRKALSISVFDESIRKPTKATETEQTNDLS